MDGKVSAEKIATPFDLEINEQKRTDDTVSESEQFRCLVENAAVPICIIDLRGRFTYVNNATAELLGYSAKELLGRSFTDFLHSGDKGRILRLFINVIGLQRPPRNLEFRVVHRDGRVLHLMSKPTRFEINGKTVGFQAIIVDITERKQMEGALKESDEKYRNIVELAPDGIVTANTKGVITSINTAFSKLTGFSKDEVVGKHFTELGSSRVIDAPKLLKFFSSLSEGKIPPPFESVYNRKDGTSGWAEVTVGFLEVDGKITGFQAMIREITERKKAEQELKDQKEKAERYLNIVGNIIVALDPHGKITLLNKKGYEILGYKEGELVGKDWFKTCLKEKDVEEVRKVFMDIMEGKIEYSEHNENPILTRTGEMRIVSWHNNPLRDYNGKIVGILSSGEDITECKKTEDALKESENKSRLLLENLPQKIFFKDKNLVYVTCNRNYARDLEIKTDEIIGRTDYEFYPRKLAEKYRADDRRVIESGKAEDIEEEYVWNGQKMFVHTVKTPFKDENGNVVGVLGIFWDITKQKKAEEQARSLSEFQKKVIDTAVVWINLLDEEGNVTLWNRAAELISGYSRKEVIGNKKIWERLYPDPKYRKEIFGNAKAIIEKGERQGNAYTIIRCKDGTSKTILWHSNSILDEKGNPIGSIAIGTDVTEIKKAQEKIAESEEKYRNLFENARDVIITSDLKGNITSVNKAVEGDGFKKSEIIGKNMFEFISKKHLPTILADLGRMAQGNPARGETELITPKGKFIVEYSGNPIIKGNNIVGSQTILRDITERRKMEDNLRESEEKYRMLVENTKDSIVIVDLRGNVLFGNKATEELTGYTLENGTRMNVRQVTPLKYWPRSLEMLLKARQGGRIPYFESMIRRKDGALIPVESGGQAIFKNGKVAGVQIITRDITERKKMKEKLEQYSRQLEEMVQKRTTELLESEKRYSVLVEEASDGVVIAQDGKFVFANKRASEIFGYPIDELVGLPFYKPVYEKYRQLVMERYTRTLRGEKVLETYEIEIVAKNGEHRPVELSATRIDYQGRSANLVLIRDISERRKMEEQRSKLEKLATIGELAAMVAHDLRNPLTSIRNATYYIKKTGSCNADANKTKLEMLDIIEQETLFANNIINDLLDFSAKRPLQKTSQNINEIILASLAKSIVQKNISVETHFAKKATATVDERQLERVLLNLAKNAVQAMPNGGKLTVTTEEKKDFVEIVLADTGVGISEESMRKLFTPLFTTKAKGIGMGLAICKKIVEEHGGTINVKSKVGEGATFTIKLSKGKRDDHQ
jgi:PAS domain S-box-containing protein